MFKSPGQRAAFFEAMKKRQSGGLNNPAAVKPLEKMPQMPKVPGISTQSASASPEMMPQQDKISQPETNSVQGALNSVTGKVPKFNNIKKIMRISKV